MGRKGNGCSSMIFQSSCSFPTPHSKRMPFAFFLFAVNWIWVEKKRKVDLTVKQEGMDELPELFGIVKEMGLQGTALSDCRSSRQILHGLEIILANSIKRSHRKTQTKVPQSQENLHQELHQEPFRWALRSVLQNREKVSHNIGLWPPFEPSTVTNTTLSYCLTQLAQGTELAGCFPGALFQINRSECILIMHSGQRAVMGIGSTGLHPSSIL